MITNLKDKIIQMIGMLGIKVVHGIFFVNQNKHTVPHGELPRSILRNVTTGNK